ncbi:MAG TPA: DEAD/DEAH box helicase [Methylophilaceae bacterium]|nr:DEAD/DEAH box helicase [Methylophilaceae bacterium]
MNKRPSQEFNLSSETNTPSLSFNELGLAQPILRAIADAGYTTPTPIQAKAIPQVLSGGDLLAGAQTGTGKTAGFTLPLLHLLQAKPAQMQPGQPRCLILTPTRELAAQVEESVKTYGKYLPLKSMVMFGGVNINPQIARLKKPLDILVATPGRLLDHVGQKTIDLSRIEILVLDEADRMLDMGFIRDIKRVLALLPKQRQNLLFSATFSDEIKALADGLLHNPGFVEVARRNTASELVEQTVHLVPQAHKRDLMSHLIRQHDWQQVLVFTRTKHGANRLAEKLVKDGIEAAAIHGNKSQGARTKALADFKSGSVKVLVATDIAARGLDIDQLPQVVNFELPNVPEDYVHRIGRTGRAGSTGAAISLVDEEEVKLLKAIERLIKREIPRVTVEGFVPSEKTVEAPRPPKPARGQGQQPRGRDGRNQARSSSGQNGQGQAGQRQGKPGHGTNKGSGNARPASQPATRSDNQPKNAQPMSEAARHQAMPQSPLFAPKPVHRGHRGR